MVRIGLLLLVVGAVGLVLAAPLPGQGRPGPQPTGRLVFLTGNRTLLSIDVATGRRTARRIRGVAGCAPQLFATGGHVVVSGVRKRRTVVLSMPATLDRPPRVLGAAHAVVPSATEGRVWLGGVDCNRRRMVGVREVGVDGAVTFRSSQLVPGRWLVGAVGRALVLHGRRPLVWDPRTGRTRAIPLRIVVTTRGALMAGCLSRSGCRRLTILDSTNSRLVETRPPGGERLDLAAQFSPDSSQLAAAALKGRRWSIALVDTRDGTTTIVPGSSTGERYPYQSWSSSGWLIFRSGGGRMMAYRPGDAQAVPLPFAWPRRALAVAAS